MSYFLSQLQAFLDPWLLFLADDPALRLLQGGMLFLGIIVIFLVFYTTRDVLLRSQSLLFMAFSIVLVALVPVIGFLLYVLVRPSKTLAEKDLVYALEELALEVRKSRRRPAKKERGVKDDKKQKESGLSL